MNYRHAYHAGNFADVFKHVVLVALIQALSRKEAGFCYLDTHAGAGLYDLDSEAAQVNQEFASGIHLIYQQHDVPSVIRDYLSCIPSQSSYPGSPFFVKSLLRSQDRMVLSELHPDEYKHLRKLFLGDKQVAVHHQDGYQSLRAFLPPREKRGLVLLDPPFENVDEFGDILRGVGDALERWEMGVHAIWYPIKDRNQVNGFVRDLRSLCKRDVLVSELSVGNISSSRLSGCGMAIVNPPWQVDAVLGVVVPWLQGVFSRKA